MSIIKTGVSAISKMLVVIALAGAFVVGAVSVIYLSLRGEEVKVPEVVGKDFNASEQELAALGLKIKKVASRYSEEKPNTIIEQRPQAGETAKTGLLISVVVSQPNPEEGEAPATVQKDTADEVDDTTDVTLDKPVKTNKNANVKKPAQTTRDVISNKSNKNAKVNSADETNSVGNSNSANSKSNSSGGNKNSSTTTVNKSAPSNSNKSEPVKSNSPKPVAAKTPATSGDTRSRKVPQN